MNETGMEGSALAFEFLKAIQDEPRIAPSHISLYMAILFIFQQQGGVSPAYIFSRDLMKYAKISGVATYSKCIQDLKVLGYIEYVPSYNPYLGSLITPKKFTAEKENS